VVVVDASVVVVVASVVVVDLEDFHGLRRVVLQKIVVILIGIHCKKIALLVLKMVR
jgi:hypothetical protein